MALTVGEIQAAQLRLTGVVRTTPLLESRWWSAVAGAPIWLKAENLQRTGSFKIRGASNMIGQLSPEQRARGVIAASAGNHAQGVAVAAQAAGIPALVVMPETAPFAKVEATRGYGAEIVQAGASYQEAAAAMELIAAERGLTVVPAFDDERIIAGQGTLGLEVVEQLPDLDLVIVPVGGGGLASGVAIAVKSLRPRARVIGVQAAAAPAAARSLRRGAVESVSATLTVADGIAVARPGAITFPLLQRYLDEIVVVGEEAISEAIVGLMEYSKLVVEGAGAVGIAALLRGKIRCAGQTTVVVLSGGNLDFNLLARIIEHGLGQSGRYLNLRVAMDDRPGRLANALAVLAGAGANVLDVQHRRTGSELTFGQVEVELLLETRNPAHAEAVCAALRDAGYREDPGEPRRGRRFVISA
ncbi:MAG TPA: threonine ammonia-lyase [Dehalococcoidia bacterium]|nr:threonine ammonia-lyase [Dehalococcoidia bacterium]